MVSNLAKLQIASETEDRYQEKMLRILDKHKDLSLLHQTVPNKNELLLESEMNSFLTEPAQEPE